MFEQRSRLIHIQVPGEKETSTLTEFFYTAPQPDLKRMAVTALDSASKAWGIYRTLRPSDREPSKADLALNAVLLAGPVTLGRAIGRIPQSIRSIRDGVDRFIIGSFDRCDL
jgi:hypothetical protein